MPLVENLASIVLTPIIELNNRSVWGTQHNFPLTMVLKTIDRNIFLLALTKNITLMRMCMNAISLSLILFMLFLQQDSVHFHPSL